MPEYIPKGYAGTDLPSTLSSFLAILEGHGFRIKASTRHAGKTINILHHDDRFGYINSSVLERGGVLGYRFRAWGGRANNACPPEIAHRVAEEFCERYGCQSEDVVVHHGTGANAGRTFLIIKNPTVALHVLLRDTEQPFDEDLCITVAQQGYVEGIVRNTEIQRHGRSSAAREACIAHYGHTCFVCKTNLRRQYRGLSLELIHVHHEAPLSDREGPRVVDPIADMKPVCPNCHAVIHSRNPPFSVTEVARMVRGET